MNFNLKKKLANAKNEKLLEVIADKLKNKRHTEKQIKHSKKNPSGDSNQTIFDQH
jgi:TusA-related sulfurtransferase